MTKALVLIADGSEEMEVVITVDVLRRANVNVTLAGILGDNQKDVTCSRNVKIVPDCSIETVLKDVYDIIILPGGGPGAKTFANSAQVGDLLKVYESNDKWISAICAAPTALKAHNIGKGKNVTSYPAFKDQLTDFYNYLEDEVVVDGKLVTSRGPGTCFAFALKLVELLQGKKVANPMPDEMVLKLN